MTNAVIDGVERELTPEEDAAYIAETTPTKDKLIAYANAKQWLVATGGRMVTINGTPTLIATTIDSMNLMDGKVSRLHQPNPPTSVNWQTGPTTFVAIEAAEFEVIATAMADFYQATFDALPDIFAKITDGTYTTRAQIDAVLTAI